MCYSRYTRSKLNLLTNANEKNERMDDGDECKTIKVDFGEASVKTNIDEDMASLQYPMKQIPSSAVEHIIPDLIHGSHVEKNHVWKNQTCKIDCDHPNIMENPSRNLNELNMQLVQKCTILQEELGDATEAFLNQKLIDVEQLTRDGELHYSNEFMDALEILKSNKELFLELSQDPKSMLGKHIQDLHNACAEKLPSKSVEKSELSEEIADSRQFKPIQRKKIHNFFRKKNQLVGNIPSMGCDSSQSSNRKVILIHSSQNIQNSTTLISRLRNQGGSKRAAYNFFLREIKRKFKHAIGECRKESILYRLQYQQHKDLGEIDETDFVATCNGEETSKISMRAKRGDKGGKSEDKNFPVRQVRTTLGTLFSLPETDFVATCNVEEPSKISIRAKRGDKGGKPEDTNFPVRQVRTTLGTMLSLPESNSLSPKLSPVKDDEPSFVPEHIRIFPYDNSKNTLQSKQEKSRSILSPSRQNVEESAFIKGDLSPKGRLDIIEITNVSCMEESNQSDVPSKLDSDRPIIVMSHDSYVTKKCVEEGSSKCLRLDPSQEKSSSVSPLGLSSSLIHETGALESISEKPEQPSPVSVLEPFLLEDVTSPASSVAQNDELPMQSPLQIYFEDSKVSSLELIASDPENNLTTCTEDKELEFNYVRTVLEASGLISTNEFFARWHSLEQPMNSYLFDEVELLSIQFPEDRELLFDSINEVLVKVYGLFFSSPFLCFFKPSFRKSLEGNNVLREVWKGIDWLILLEFPLTLDQIVRKDMEKEGTWMDLRYNTEEIGIEMGENILEELMEDTLLKLFQINGQGDDDDDGELSA